MTGSSARTTAAALLAILLAGSSGCNVDPTQGYTLASPHRKGIKTVAVHVFTRGENLYRRDFEMRLTEAVIKRLELDTPYKVTTKGRADTLLTGTLVGVSQRVLSHIPDTGRAREREVIITAQIRWEDLRTGKLLVDRETVRAAGVYISPPPFTENFFQGSEDAINRLAKRIVEKLEADW